MLSGKPIAETTFHFVLVNQNFPKEMSLELAKLREPFLAIKFPYREGLVFRPVADG